MAIHLSSHQQQDHHHCHHHQHNHNNDDDEHCVLCDQAFDILCAEFSETAIVQIYENTDAVAFYAPKEGYHSIFIVSAIPSKLFGRPPPTSLQHSTVRI